jgi:organic hydroperoxide reductase OsmC/OhrA
MNKHTFKATLHWPINEGTHEKSHIVSIDGKEDLAVSAAKAFKGDPKLYNPEDLLLSSLMSCHMMSYLYCCSREGIEIISYQDYAEAILETQSDGSGKITKVTLRPEVIINDSHKADLALTLHKKANQLCIPAKVGHAFRFKVGQF